MFPVRGAQQRVEPLYVEDVFSAFTYTGNGSTQSIVNGIDLAGKGGLVWSKNRGAVGNHSLQDTVNSAGFYLKTNLTDAIATTNNLITAFNSDGYSVGTAALVNSASNNYVGWTFRKATKFFDVVTYTGDGVAGRTISHSLGINPGMIIVKPTSAVGNWVVYHRSRGAGERGELNSTGTFGATTSMWNSEEPTSSVFTLGNGDTNTNGVTFVAYLFAHDTTSDGIIQCGSFTTNGSGIGSVTLGWEPQYVLIKRTDGTGSWLILDTSRGLDLSSSDKALQAQSTAVELSSGYAAVNATGFIQDGVVSATYIYMAIRKGLMRVPTDASKVFAINARTGTGAAATVTAGSITQGVDLVISKRRNSTVTWNLQDRLRGTASQLTSETTAAQTTDADRITAFNMNDISIDVDGTLNASAATYINYLLKQARGFFDIVSYIGTGSSHYEAHNLGAEPELIIIKDYSSVRAWGVYHGNALTSMTLNATDAAISSGYWNNTAPTESSFRLGTSANINTSGANYIAYLFASCPGVSKIGTYVGNGAVNPIDCGFVSGARFVLIKRIDSTGDWYLWDSTRGIVSGNDPYLLLNSIAADVTSTDYVDPYSAGFGISSSAPAAINASGGTYLYLAIA